MLSIRDLHANVAGKEILRGINLDVAAGQVHAIMGPNGSGKSTLSYVLAGRDGYSVTSGSIEYKGKNLLDMNPEQRGCEGIFLGFQYPIEIPGVKTTYFIKSAINAIRKYRNQPALDTFGYIRLVREKTKLLSMDEALLNRSVNEGFSGGEKKRNEIFQMAMLDPELAVLDETDSGLDIDALKQVASGVNSLRNEHRAMIVITHYQRLLEFIVPDFVHVLSKGRIVRSGDRSLALELEEQGYGWLEETA